MGVRMVKASDTAEQVDLESAICDVADMANICLMLMDLLERNACSTSNLEKVTAKQALDHLAYYRGAASFAVLHLNGMTTALKKQYLGSAE
jgi:hypothetical protein